MPKEPAPALRAIIPHFAQIEKKEASKQEKRKQCN